MIESRRFAFRSQSQVDLSRCLCWQEQFISGLSQLRGNQYPSAVLLDLGGSLGLIELINMVINWFRLSS